jgi:AcrR family transcriptional regulator
MQADIRGMQQRGIESRQALLDAAGVVFARMPYSQARLKDISDESGISPGSLYFHFGNKEDVARAVLAAQQERMTKVLASATAGDSPALEKVIHLFDGLAKLIATDHLVQAGIRLSLQPATGLEITATTPYFEWVDVAARLIAEGASDGSIAETVNVTEAAELLNEIFVGAQVLAGLEDDWHSLPARITRAHWLIRELLTERRNSDT